jgi:hypothetical protein
MDGIIASTLAVSSHVEPKVYFYRWMSCNAAIQSRWWPKIAGIFPYEKDDGAAT